MIAAGLLTCGTHAQEYGDAQHYLVDSLNLSQLSTVDVQLLDSGLRAYHHSLSDTGRIKALHFMIEGSYNDAVWPRYNQFMYDLALEGLSNSPTAVMRDRYRRAEADAINNFGYYAQVHLANIDSALRLFHQSLAIWEELGDSAQIVTLYNNLGANYGEQGNIPVALEYHHKALRYLERNGGKFNAAYQLSNLALLHLMQEEHDLALAYNKRALTLRRELNDQLGIATSLSNIAHLLNLRGERDSARHYYETALEINERVGHRPALGTGYNNLGTLLVQDGQLEEAWEYFEKGLALSEATGDKGGQAKTLKNMAHIQWKKGAVEEAWALAERGLQLAQEASNAVAIKSNAGLLTIIAAHQQRYAEALEYRNLEVLMRDSLASEKAIKTTARLEARYAYEKKSAADKALIAEQKLALSQRQHQLLLLVGGLLVLALMVGMLLLRLRLSRIKHELEAKKKQLDLSMVISDNKVRYDFNQQLIANLEALKAVEVDQLKSKINRYIVDLKNQLHFEEKQNHLSDNIATLHTDFEEKLKQRFPELTAAEISICHMFRLNMSVKEIANLKQTSEGAIRTARYRIKSKLHLDKDQSLDDYIKASI